MRLVLIIVIRLYWLLIPKEKRRKCIFRKSCSLYVYDQTVQTGFLEGVKALRFRMANCQPSFYIYTDPETGRLKMVLRSGTVIDESEIAERFK